MAESKDGDSSDSFNRRRRESFMVPDWFPAAAHSMVESSGACRVIIFNGRAPSANETLV
jgi:hypothetical protein